VGYYSATLNEAERNYNIYNLELLAIVKALRNWRPLLAGSPHDIRVFSDHMNLQYWRNPQKISRRVAREFLELQEFPIKIHHIKGKTNGRADALSRRPDYNQGEHDNANITVLPDKLFIRSLIEIGAEHDEQDDYPSQMGRCTRTEKDRRSMVQERQTSNHQRRVEHPSSNCRSS
jgi:hypothetical protein